MEFWMGEAVLIAILESPLLDHFGCRWITTAAPLVK